MPYQTFCIISQNNEFANLLCASDMVFKVIIGLINYKVIINFYICNINIKIVTENYTVLLIYVNICIHLAKCEKWK